MPITVTLPGSRNKHIKKAIEDALSSLSFAGISGVGIADDDKITLGTSLDVTIEWDTAIATDQLQIGALADDTIITFGIAASTQKSFDITWFGHQASGASYLYFDASADSIYTTGIDVQFKDTDFLVFGTGSDKTGDVAITWDGTNLIISATTDDSVIEIGDAGTSQLSFDLKWYGQQASGASYLYFNASDDLIYTTGIDLQFKDNDILVIGTGGGGGGDVQFVWDTANLITKAIADDTLWEIGDSASTQLSFDLKWYAGQASGASFLYFDASEDLISTTGVDIQFLDTDSLVFGTGSDKTGDVAITWDGVNLIVSATADDSVIEIGDSGTPQLSFDLKWYGQQAGGASYLYFDASGDLISTTGVDLQFKDNDILIIGSGTGAAGDVQFVWDTANLIMKTAVDDTLWEIGDSAATQLSFDIKWYGHQSTGASFLYFDASDNLIYTTDVDLQFKDNDILIIGSGAGVAGDVQFVWDTVNLIMKAAVDDTVWEIGDSAATQLSFDIKWYGGAASGASFLYFDASDNLVYTTDVDLQFKDNDMLVFGTGAGAAGDVGITWDGVNLIVSASADDSIIEIGDSGATQKSFDVKIYGNATNGADYLFWDAGNSWLTTVGAAVLAGRVDDANGIGITLSVKSTTGDPGTTGTPVGTVVYNTFDHTISVKESGGWVSTGALT